MIRISHARVIVLGSAKRNRRRCAVLAALVTAIFGQVIRADDVATSPDSVWRSQTSPTLQTVDAPTVPGSLAITCDSVSQDCCCDGLGVGGDQPRQSRFHLSEFNVYPTFSYLDEFSATYVEFEFASHTDLGWLEMENRTVLNVADLPSTIQLGPTNPGNEPDTEGTRANSFGDILSGFFFSQPGAHEQTTHLGVGPVLTFPTASNKILGSSQFSAGSGVHFSTEINRLTAGFFLWQSWGFGESRDDQKKINQLFGKAFFIYEYSENWNLVYVPLGLSHSWDAPNDDDWTVPIGGGVRKLFEVHGQKMGLQVEGLDYVSRKPKDPEWELRATIEFLYD